MTKLTQKEARQTREYLAKEASYAAYEASCHVYDKFDWRVFNTFVPLIQALEANICLIDPRKLTNDQLKYIALSADGMSQMLAELAHQMRCAVMDRDLREASNDAR